MVLRAMKLAMAQILIYELAMKVENNFLTRVVIANTIIGIGLFKVDHKSIFRRFNHNTVIFKGTCPR